MDRDHATCHYNVVVISWLRLRHAWFAILQVSNSNDKLFQLLIAGGQPPHDVKRVQIEKWVLHRL